MELRRVPLGFDWPVGKMWQGFLCNVTSPAVQCLRCDGTGMSDVANHLRNLWYGYAMFRPEERGSTPFLPTDAPVRRFAERNIAHAPEYERGEVAIMREAGRLATLWNGKWSHHLNADDVAALIADGRLKHFTHTFDRVHGYQPKSPPYIPTPREVNEWSISSIGHDSEWVCVKAECIRLSKPYVCDACDGEGVLWPSAEAKAAYEEARAAWKPTPPPEGDGYQIWETVSSGSPISPVFATPERLAAYMAIRKWGAEKETSAEQWLAFITGPGFAPTAVLIGDKLMTGVQAVSAGW